MKNSCFIPTEADGRQSTTKLLPRDCDLYRPVPIESAVPTQGRSLRLYVGLVAHLRQRLDQVLLVGHCCGEFLVLAHMPPIPFLEMPVCQTQQACLIRSKILPVGPRSGIAWMPVGVELRFGPPPISKPERCTRTTPSVKDSAAMPCGNIP